MATAAAKESCALQQLEAREVQLRASHRKKAVASAKRIQKLAWHKLFRHISGFRAKQWSKFKWPEMKAELKPLGSLAGHKNEVPDAQLSRSVGSCHLGQRGVVSGQGKGPEPIRCPILREGDRPRHTPPSGELVCRVGPEPGATPRHGHSATRANPLGGSGSLVSLCTCSMCSTTLRVRMWVWECMCV